MQTPLKILNWWQGVVWGCYDFNDVKVAVKMNNEIATKKPK